jgi:hypothetical protein
VAEGGRVSWSTELQKIRRLLRDPTGAIWSEPFLRHLWNDVSQDFQHMTNVLEDVVAQRVPAVYQFAYQFDWEWRFLPTDISQFYQCLQQHDEKVFCHRWEPQEVTGISADVADYGIHFTQPWEAYMSETPGDLVKMRFPANFGTMRFVAYDEDPICALTRKQVQSADPSNVTKEGLPIGYYLYDDTDNCYVLYPRPSAAFDNELSGEAMALYAAGDTEDANVGQIAVRLSSSDSDIGIPVDIVDTTNSVFMVYTVTPTEIRTGLDESDFPGFLRKYLRFGVASRAYGGNNDGRIRSLSDYWGLRYTLGIEFTKRYMRNRRQDRDYRLTTSRTPVRRSVRHPRLPDAYPATNP